MNDNSSRILIGASLVLCVATFALALLQPAYLGDYFYLEALIFVEVMLVALSRFARRFFPVLIGVFLWAGIDIPLRDLWVSRRWFVLAIAAVAGFAIYLRNRRHQFTGFHLVAFGCVLSAVISAMVSSLPQTAILKALSLFLLFIYAATGARLAVIGREGKFFFGVLAACELLVWVGAISYFIFHHAIFGNPNSMGAIMGVVVLPVLLWGTTISHAPAIYRRRMAAFLVGLLLLFVSYSRAGIVAALISCVVLCICLGRYRLLVKGAAIATVAALLIAALSPMRAEEAGSLWQFVFKGEQLNGVLASRSHVWDETVASIRQRPWFGSGFGTGTTDYDTTVSQANGFESNGVTREHGNSYLAITEWVGLLGVVPFLILIVIVAVRTIQVLIWLNRTKDLLSPAVPIALIMLAGLIHAGFEDWMFAVGYYLCVFFWSMAFVMFDVLPFKATAVAETSSHFAFTQTQGNLELAIPGQ